MDWLLRTDGDGARQQRAGPPDDLHLCPGDGRVRGAHAQPWGNQVVAWRTGRPLHPCCALRAPHCAWQGPGHPQLPRSDPQRRGPQAHAWHRGGRHWAQVGNQQQRQRLPPLRQGAHSTDEHVHEVCEALQNGRVLAPRPCKGRVRHHDTRQSKHCFRLLQGTRQGHHDCHPILCSAASGARCRGGEAGVGLHLAAVQAAANPGYCLRPALHWQADDRRLRQCRRTAAGRRLQLLGGAARDQLQPKEPLHDHHCRRHRRGEEGVRRTWLPHVQRPARHLYLLHAFLHGGGRQLAPHPADLPLPPQALPRRGRGSGRRCIPRQGCGHRSAEDQVRGWRPKGTP
mmetsp:Transcript_13342/g.53141  ORF Transcript_13342/g.53141 Transcript_13342/m.53141 type:complete len:342 (+) Transcript_13342:434-1459(+)